MVYFLVLIFIILADQVTKIAVAAQGTGWSMEIIPGLFSFDYTQNKGAAFSCLSGVGWAQDFFAILTFIILPVLYIAFLYMGKNRKWLKTSFVLLIGGTLGNFIDRIVFNSVTDFIHIHFFPAIFNVADIALTVGAIMLIVWFVFLDDEAIIPIGKKKRKNEKQN